MMVIGLLENPRRLFSHIACGLWTYFVTNKRPISGVYESNQRTYVFIKKKKFEVFFSSHTFSFHFGCKAKDWFFFQKKKTYVRRPNGPTNNIGFVHNQKSDKINHFDVKKRPLSSDRIFWYITIYVRT